MLSPQYKHLVAQAPSTCPSTVSTTLSPQYKHLVAQAPRTCPSTVSTTLSPSTNIWSLRPHAWCQPVMRLS